MASFDVRYRECKDASGANMTKRNKTVEATAFTIDNCGNLVFRESHTFIEAFGAGFWISVRRTKE